MEEIWKDIEGYEGYYQVSNLGRVKSLQRTVYGRKGSARPVQEKVLSPRINKYGYSTTVITSGGFKRYVSVHRLVAIAFIPNPDNLPQVNHINGIKTDNRVENLEWVTAKENVRHSYDVLNRKGFSARGTARKNAKMNDEIVADIKREIEKGTSLVVLAKKYGVVYKSIHQIKAGVRWKHVKI
jgi:hypothetical protein